MAPKSKPYSIYDHLYAERKLDADDITELSICFAEHRKPRSPLDQLAPDIQTAILELMSERPAWMVAELLAQPMPVGLALKTNDASLNKWRARHKQRAEKAALQVRHSEIETIIINNQGSFFHSAIHLMESRLLKALANDNTSPDDLQRISRSLATLRRQALAEGNPVNPYRPAETSPDGPSPEPSEEGLRNPPPSANL